MVLYVHATPSLRDIKGVLQRKMSEPLQGPGHPIRRLDYDMDERKPLGGFHLDGLIIVTGAEDFDLVQKTRGWLVVPLFVEGTCSLRSYLVAFFSYNLVGRGKFPSQHAMLNSTTLLRHHKDACCSF
jgi:hypothetical protein